jgi:hypothetical protein
VSETAVAYRTKEPNSVGIPARWLRFLYRVAGLERGRVYTITVIVPSQADHEPQWAISEGVKVENAR